VLVRHGGENRVCVKVGGGCRPGQNPHIGLA
jgi:hypothetical protein